MTDGPGWGPEYARGRHAAAAAIKAHADRFAPSDGNHAQRRLRRHLQIAERLALPPEHAAEALARRFHETYERLAPAFGYKTRDASAVPWEQVPAANRDLMIAVCAEIVAATGMQIDEPTVPERDLPGAAWLIAGRAGRDGAGDGPRSDSGVSGP